jgi:Zn-dependent peptidase ImmA (M78 family)
VPTDLALLAKKIRMCRQTYGLSPSDLAGRSGITEERISDLEEAKATPSGDEILVLSDVFLCDFKFFLSDEVELTFKRVRKLFRMLGEELSDSDRWSINEFLFLCEGEDYLEAILGRVRAPLPIIPMRTSFQKGHGADGAKEIRRLLQLGEQSIMVDPYSMLRRFNVHIFRRRMSGSNLSGLTLRHPEIGPCVLVNYDEDVFRQRFTLAHEFGHALLDIDDTIVVSHKKWSGRNLSEIRANTFAAHLVCPGSALTALPEPRRWDADRLRTVSRKLGLNPAAVLIALKEAKLLTADRARTLDGLRIDVAEKEDPEFLNLTDAGVVRKRTLLERGLTNYYVGLAFDAFDAGLISRGRLGQLLLVPPDELPEIEQLFGRIAAS